MLSFEEYSEEILNLEDEIAAVERRMEYRRIELLGPRLYEGTNPSRRLTDEEEIRLDRDHELIELRHSKQILQSRLWYLKGVGELPKLG